MPDMETTVCGIPCIVRIHDWEPYVPAKLGGPPENCYPAEGGYGSWEVLDRRGRPAPWLAKKITRNEKARIEEAVFEFMESDR